MNISRTMRAAVLAALFVLIAPLTARSVSAAPAGGAASVTSVSVNVESASLPIKPTNHSVPQVRAGQPFRLILYVGLAGVISPVTAKVSLHIAQGGRRDFASEGTFTTASKDMGGSPQGTRWFWNTVKPCAAAQIANCLPRTPGKYAVTVTVSINGKMYTRNLTLTEVG